MIVFCCRILPLKSLENENGHTQYEIVKISMCLQITSKHLLIKNQPDITLWGECCNVKWKIYWITRLRNIYRDNKNEKKWVLLEDASWWLYVWYSSYQIPLPSGQSRTALEFIIKWPVGFWNKKWSCERVSDVYVNLLCTMHVNTRVVITFCMWNVFYRKTVIRFFS